MLFDKALVASLLACAVKAYVLPTLQVLMLTFGSECL